MGFVYRLEDVIKSRFRKVKDVKVKDIVSFNSEYSVSDGYCAQCGKTTLHEYLFAKRIYRCVECHKCSDDITNRFYG